MVYDTFAVFSKWIHIAIGFCKRCSKLSKLFRNYQNCSEIYKIDPFIGQLPNENLAWQNFTRALPGLVYRIPPVRPFG